MMFTNILIPFDKSDHALRAFEVAKGLAAEDAGIKLRIVDVCHVASLPLTMGVDSNAIDPDAFAGIVAATLAREKEEVLTALGGALDGLPNPVEIDVLNAASVAGAIDDYAKEHGCDLIVMGARGLGALRGMIGSVSYGVIRSTDIPVLVVKDAREEPAA